MDARSHFANIQSCLKSGSNPNPNHLFELGRWQEHQKHKEEEETHKAKTVVDLSDGFKKNTKGLVLVIHFLCANMLKILQGRNEFSFNNSNTYKEKLQDGLEKMFAKSHEFIFPSTASKKMKMTNTIKIVVILEFMAHFLPGMSCTVLLFFRCCFFMIDH